MRALIVSFLLTTAAGPLPFHGEWMARAAEPSVQFSTSLKNEHGSTGTSSEGIATASTFVASTDFNSGSALGAVALRVGTDRIEPAYERVLITDRQGTTRPLSAIFPGVEHALRAGVDLTLPGSTISLDGMHTLGESAYPGYSFSARLSHDRYPTGTRYLAELSRSDFTSPRSYFVSPETFQTRERPGRLLENQAKLGAEQMLGERTRGRFTASYAIRPDRRPAKAGLETSFGWAFHDDKALITTIGTARERRSGSLYDDRGYLDAYWLQAEVRWEPAYAWRLYGRAGTMLEAESARGRLGRQRVGTDSVGFELRHLGGRYEAGLSSLAAFSNTGYRNLQIGGKFVWRL